MNFDPIAVLNGGVAEMVLKFAPPPGCHWTEDAPSAWQVIPNGESIKTEALKMLSVTYAIHPDYIIGLTHSFGMFTDAVTFNPAAGSLVERSEVSLSLTPHFPEGGSSLSVEVRELA